ncbi:MAG TPA: DNA replication/repair protein RecF [Candidatus Saccharimonadales bacterium]|nr:DNA replication/repair protein RecF [Candidatus Saccharimonadales bacterium]
MYRKIHLKNFRSYKDTTFDLSDGVNMVVGPNGSGKTNLLEALYVTSYGSSFRVQDSNLIHHDADWLHLATNDEQAVERSLRIRRDPQKETTTKEFRINDVSKRLNVNTRIPVVLFEPRDMQLLTGSPDQRRLFLDVLLTQLSPTYERILTRYKRSLAQRNRLLKDIYDHIAPQDQLFVWNVRLSELGAHIMNERQDLIDRVNKLASDAYSQLSHKASKVQLHHQTAVKGDVVTLASAFLHQLETNLSKDQERGFTSVGPHRDDFTIDLDGSPAHFNASRGELRTLVVMLKIVEATLLYEVSSRPPLLLLDDVFGELDATRRKALSHHLTPWQTIITTPESGIEGSIPKNRLGQTINLG